MVHKILIIEDEQQVLNNVREILQLSGFETLIALNGQTGLEIATQTLPDLILCDIMMPKLDGYGVLSALREKRETAHLPVIFLTAQSERSDFRYGMELGADDYLTKPFTPEELLKAIEIRLEKQVATQQHTQDQLNELRMNIAHSLPHELNTPLNGILGMSQLLLQSYDTIEKCELFEIAETIYTSAHRLYRLTQNFLLYANLELILKDLERVSEIRSRAAHCLSKDIITDIALNKAKELGREKDLKLELKESTAKIPQFELSKIIEEVIDNAFKFSQPGTEVKVINRVSENLFNLYIIDHGRGITTHNLERVGAYIQFERKLYEQQGSGLGLAIVHRILELYNGQLIIESLPCRQTIVNILLPCYKSSKALM